MRIEIGQEQIERNPASVVTIGTFDGVHRGHLAIMEYLMERARAQQGASTVVTFEPHPREVVQNVSVPLLTTVDERAAILREIGIDRFIVIPFTREFSRLPARAFVHDVLFKQVGLQEVVIGYDHAFGHDREGDARLLEELGRTLGFGVDVIPAQVVHSHVVSSSEVRRALQEGRVDDAASMLGRRYEASGVVVEGDARGRTIGFPTANLQVDVSRKIVPADGVYAVYVSGPGFTRRAAMMNIGVRPTVDGRRHMLEVHIIDFEGDLYGDRLRVEFARRLRDEKRFASIEELKKQLSEDRARCKAALESLS